MTNNHNNTSRHPLLTLPQELQDNIFSYLDKQGIHDKNAYATCRSLNRDWHAHFTPLFWNQLSITEPATLKALMAQPELRVALTTNAHLIKHLKTARLDVLEFFVHSPPSRPPPFSDPSPPSMPFSASRGSTADPALATKPDYIDRIALENLPLWDCNYLLLCLTAEYLPRLQKLKITWELDNGGLCDLALKQFLEGSSETIQELRIQFDSRSHLQPRRFSSPQLDIQVASRSHPALKMLEIEDKRMDHNMGNYEHVLGDFLRGCNGKHLQKLILPGMVRFMPKTLAILHEIRFIDTELVVRRHRLLDIADAELAWVINCNPYWKHVDLGGSNNFGPITERAVLGHCEKFTHLMVNNCRPGFSSCGILTVLRRASKLEQLYTTIFRAWGAIPHDPVLDTLDIVSCTVLWQCAQTLQVLECEIAHVPQPDVLVGYRNQSLEAHPDHMGTMEQSRAIQHRIYRRLGQLTQLRKLGLGWTMFLLHWTCDDNDGDDEHGGQRPRPVFDSRFQLACLEMNLESGLEELADLKELTILDVSRMAHRVGVRELEWMQQSWPKLTHIYGLYHPGFEGQPGVQEWVEQHQPQWHAESPPGAK
ncbi:hypothetical protein BGZ74_009018 [Mortierella antarctica]|nr:hypothetical protein BGZ74_009018 [Mortierella antarctica]